MNRLLLPVLVTACFAVAAPSRGVEIDPQIPAYKPVDGISGQLKAVGSDTLSKLVMVWSDGFKALYPKVTIEIQSEGSSTAPPALTEGASQLATMSRPMTSDEIVAFEKKFGYTPTAIPVAVDAIAVYVNKDNPIKCLTIPQLDRVFSKTHLYSNGGNVTSWGGVGLSGDWADKSISLFGRNSSSGTHDTFVSTVLAHGEFKDELKEQPTSEDVVKNVAGDKFAIGYSGIAFSGEGVRAVPLAISAGSECYDPSWEATRSNKYPLERFLYIYFNKDPKRPLEPVVEAFVKYIVSRDGQAETIKTGLYPLIPSTRIYDLHRLGISTETQ